MWLASTVWLLFLRDRETVQTTFPLWFGINLVASTLAPKISLEMSCLDRGWSPLKPEPEITVGLTGAIVH